MNPEPDNDYNDNTSIHDEDSVHSLESDDNMSQVSIIYDRLMETSPVIPDDIIHLFTTSLGQSKDFDKISKPEICDELISTENYRNQWFSEDTAEKREQREIREKMEIQLKNKRIRQMHIDDVKHFKEAFRGLNSRDPLREEIIDNLKDKIEITVLENIIDELQLISDRLNVDASDNI